MLSTLALSVGEPVSAYFLFRDTSAQTSSLRMSAEVFQGVGQYPNK
jgi:hypothetical protein